MLLESTLPDAASMFPALDVSTQPRLTRRNNRLKPSREWRSWALTLSLRLTLGLCLLSSGPTDVNAQNLTQSWLSDSSKDFGQQPSTTITLTLIGTNPLFYTYATDVKASPQGNSDADTVLNTLAPAAAAAAAAPRAPGAPADPCDAPLSAVTADIGKLTKPGGPTPTSVSVQKSISEWNANVATDYATLESTTCSGAQESQAKSGFEKMHVDLFPPSGVTSSVATIQAVDCKNYTVTFREFYNGQATGQSVAATFTTACEQLTLSAGTILTALPNPTYSSVVNPANTTQQVLSVQNSGGLRPTVVGLMNYNFPGTSNTSGFLSSLHWTGLAVSTGPVFQNAQSNASVFGWYLGGSVSLYKRLFITGGEHWGQFSDAPLGLTKGSIIPSGYGQLNPVLRYSGRFALGITFQTTSFSNVGKQNKTQTGVAATPQK